MSLIIGAQGYKKLQSGYETNVNDTLRTSYTVANSETDGILPGDLLLTSSAPKVYTRAKAALEGTHKIAGIALATNVLLDPMFPQSANDNGPVFKKGTRGVAVLRGTVAVPLHGNAPVEGAAVYYVFTYRAFTTESSGTIAFAGARFTGRTEGNITEVYVQYL